MKIENTPLAGTFIATSGITDVKNISFSSLTSLNELEFTESEKEKGYLDTKTIYQKETGTSTNPLLDKIVENTTDSFPYSHMADDSNIISYKGATFVGDSETNTLCLGDMSQKENVLSIPLSDGGTLKVNRDNIGQLANAIDMFSPADINRIMQAISTDAKAQSKVIEIENMRVTSFLKDNAE